MFTELGIPWHAGVDGGPSDHLPSSQVQCVNAAGQVVTNSSRIVRAFGDLLGIDTILPIEPGQYLTFEHIGPPTTSAKPQTDNGPAARTAPASTPHFRHRAY